MCLKRILSRHYIHSHEIRSIETSHCWNPKCGRWAFRASTNSHNKQEVAGEEVCREASPRKPLNLLALMQSNVDESNFRHTGQNNSWSLKEIMKSRVVTMPKFYSTAAVNVAETFITCNVAGNSTNEENLKNVLNCRVSRMKMCSNCRRAKYCSKLCQIYDWRSGRHKMECHWL